ncbi:MAG: hypothetical protein PHN31_00590 [Candidatus Gracilibacteria bacterium]|nr:hypothetical protein [Candidatus Gracilibacteria bacterium]
MGMNSIDGAEFEPENLKITAKTPSGELVNIGSHVDPSITSGDMIIRIAENALSSNGDVDIKNAEITKIVDESTGFVMDIVDGKKQVSFIN